ncbi:Cellulose synthase [Melia azedarach]|uniref:Cellulose synthase n=1 Tax=Melia azedarach TaxID=155640 RepID=A0ACC1YHZ0_MELAZ|nr:Cellulose synthase [Melia azedarach]
MQKLHVYLSDDGGSSITLLGIKEAWKFARWWLPFCKKYGIQTICPEAFFSSPEDDYDSGSAEFSVERQQIKVGFMYHSLLEDVFTGFKSVHCKGRTSGYLNPKRPQCLGTSTTRLNDLLVQGIRWHTALVQVAISKFCPLIYGPPRMSLLQSMAYAELAFLPLLYCLSLWCFATIPQLCLVLGIPLYPPQVSSSSFYIFLFIFVSALSRHLYEVLSTGGSIGLWRNEQRIWMKSVTSALYYGSLNALMEKFGLAEASFLPTNKAVDDKEAKLYQMGIFDFRTSTMLLAGSIGDTVCLEHDSFCLWNFQDDYYRGLGENFCPKFSLILYFGYELCNC